MVQMPRWQVYLQPLQIWSVFVSWHVVPIYREFDADFKFAIEFAADANVLFFSIFAVLRIWSIFMAKLVYEDPCPLDPWFRIRVRVVSKNGLPEFGPPFAKIFWQLLREGRRKKRNTKKVFDFFWSSVIDSIQPHKTKV
jgi:hypothetical protein